MDTKSPAAQQNYYRVLSLSPTASADEIRKAISRELRMWSNRTNAPDIARRQEAERMVRILGEAETILLDDGKRKVYDRELTSLPTEQREIGDAELDADGDLVAEAWRLLTNGEVPDALYVATKATERDGNNPQAWAVLAQAKFRWGETEDAIYEYKRAIKLKPNEASYYFDLGSVYESLDKAPDALQQYQRASQIDPKTTMYRAAVGVMLLKTDKIEQGTEILERCTQEEPDNASYQWFLALAYTNDAHRNWVFVPPGDERGIPSGYYATKKEHVTRAQAMIAKAERMKFNDPDLTKHIKAVHADIDKMMVRRFHGSIVTPIIGGLIYTYFAYGLGLILAPLYFWVSRPPQYALNARALRGEGGPTTAMQWEPGTGFVENVAGGLFTAAIWGLFLPIMVIWNFVKFRTGDNDLGEFNVGSQGGSSNARDDAASEAKAFVAEVDVGPIARDGDASTTTAHASDDTSASHVENNASFARNESNRLSAVVPDFGNKLSSLFSTPEGQRNALLIGIALCVVAGIAVWVLHGRITTASDNGGSLSANTASEVQLYTTRLSIVRNMPTTLGSQVIAKLSRGDAVQGNWVTGSDGVHQWLRIATGAYQGDFVSGINLSPLQRPIMVRAVDQDMRLQQPAQLFGTPNSADTPLDTLQAGSTVHVTGEVEGGWMEIQRKSGGVGYLPTQSFGAAQNPPTPPTQSEARYYYVVGLDPKGDNWLAVRSEPSPYRGARLMKIGPDTLLTVLGREGDWLRVQLQSGQVGWANSKYIACCRTNDASVASLSARPFHAILSQGVERLRQTWMFDFEHGIEPTAPGAADFWLDSEDGSRERTTFDPKNGAQIAIIAGSNVDYDTCDRASLSDTPVPLSSVSEGTLVCIKTRSGHLGRFRIAKIDGNGTAPPFVVTLEYTTWN